MFIKQKAVNYVTFLALFILAQSAYALNPIDTQVGPDGMSVHLVKVKVGNGVLTASMLYDNDTDSNVYIKRPELKEVHYVAGTKKFPVLKDANGDWLAAPIGKENKLFRFESHSSGRGGDFRFNKGAKEVIWFKFPAPPEGTSSVEISVPGVSPFTADITQ